MQKWCSICRRYHGPQDRSRCRPPAPGSRSSRRGPFPFAGVVVIALIAGFAAGQLTEDAVVAVATALSIVVPFGVYRLVKWRRSKK